MSLDGFVAGPDSYSVRLILPTAFVHGRGVPLEVILMEPLDSRTLCDEGPMTHVGDRRTLFPVATIPEGSQAFAEPQAEVVIGVAARRELKLLRCKSAGRRN